MLHVSPWKSLAVLATCLLALLFSVPNFFSRETVQSWPDWLPKQQMPLGLDLRGGAHLLLAMDTEALRKDWLENLRADVRKQLRETQVLFSAPAIAGNGVRVRITNADDVEKAATELRKLIQPIGNAILGTSGNELELEREEANTLTLRPTDQGLAARITNAAAASIATVNRRLNASGLTEPYVVPQGRDRILVQVPGLQDTKELKALLGQTARLSLHALHPDYASRHLERPQRPNTIPAAQAATLRVPDNYRLYPSAEFPDEVYLLEANPVVRGDELKDAQPDFDQRRGEPLIRFTLNFDGARKFGRFTSNPENISRPFAIVLDDQVISAPNILEPITGGSGQISGSFTQESANTLAIQLRSGALPTKLTIIEERTVGPSLGADSIEAGKVATLIGFIGVAAFITSAYGLFGLFAIIALVVNLAFIFATLSLLQATLTLPGIAGIVLTMGMSVDANVLINERIRDEIRLGRSAISALDAGFTRAYGTIFDTNMTGLLAALILIAFGSGPVRGFGVTLAIGIVASAFTATTVTRYLVAGWLRSTRPALLPI